MNLRDLFSSLGGRIALCVIAIGIAAGIVLVLPHSRAQQTSAEAAPQPKSGGIPAAQPQQQAQAQTPASAPAAQGEPKLIYAPWTKICPPPQQPNAKRMCFTGRDARAESGAPVVAAVLIEEDGDPRKMLRVTLPLGMLLQSGTRLVIDQGQPITAPYAMCAPSGCMADYEVTEELIGRMKTGQNLAVQGISGQGQTVSLALPLADFAKAHDGPPTDPKVFAEQKQKLQAEVEKNNAPQPARPR